MYLFGWLSKLMTRLNSDISNSPEATITKFGQELDHLEKNPGEKDTSP